MPLGLGIASKKYYITFRYATYFYVHGNYTTKNMHRERRSFFVLHNELTGNGIKRVRGEVHC